ncbi:acyltransferase family protein [Altericroceibacterium xinjiangense]|uniref:acyltransferase family protein n=1 Tax=Altericroceibacterium xinjiangense TaxID=762261 RepID=UPI000F7DFE1B|nr:acyltransferase [Altericroceibacterium xinjiangense]
MIDGRSEIRPLLSIEGLRFISSVAIVYTHLSMYPMGGQPLGGGLRIFVDLFFVISGIVITTAYGSRVGTLPEYGLYLQRRFARLYPLHFATMMVFLGIAALAWAGKIQVNNPDKYDPQQFLLYMTLTQAWFGNGSIAWNAVSWSISAELVAYILFPALLLILRGGAFRGASAVFAMLAVAVLLARLLLDQEVTLLASKVSWLRCIPSFAAGIWLAHNQASVGKIGGTAGRLLLYGGSGLLVGKLAFDLPELVGLMAVWGLVAGAYACDLHGVRTLPSINAISSQGRLTYSLYLIHPIVGTIWMSFLAPKVGGVIFYNMWVDVAVGFALTFIISHFSFVYFEEPFRKLLGRPVFRARDPRLGA